MFQLRGIWIIDRVKKQFILSRIFTTAKDNFTQQLQINSSTFLNKFLSLTSIGETNPNFSINTITTYWPIISITINDISYLALPKIDDIKSKKKETINNINTFFQNPFLSMKMRELPEITGTFYILNDLSSRYDKLNKTLGKTILNYLHMYISQSLPFGRPLDTNPENVHEILTKKFVDTKLTKKQPSWKAHSYNFKKQKLVFVVREIIRSVQLDDNTKKKMELANSIHCSGKIICNCEVSGFSHVKFKLDGTDISNLVVNNCNMNYPQNYKQPCPMKIEFLPDIGSFAVCEYIIDNVSRSPIRGIFQMKEVDDYSVKFLLQLRTDNVKFVLEYCNVIFPFPNRTSIVSHKFENHYGIIVVSSDKHKLTWKIGPKFQKQEMALKGTIYFDKNEKKTGEIKDAFIKGNNMCLKLKFKILNECLSGCKISDVILSPHSKVHTLIIQKEIISSKIKIWNTLADFR